MNNSTGSSRSAAKRGRTSGHRHAGHQPERLHPKEPADSLRSFHSTSLHSIERPRPQRRACRAPCGSSSALWGAGQRGGERTNRDQSGPQQLTQKLSQHNTTTTLTSGTPCCSTAAPCRRSSGTPPLGLGNRRTAAWSVVSWREGGCDRARERFECVRVCLWSGVGGVVSASPANCQRERALLGQGWLEGGVSMKGWW